MTNLKELSVSELHQQIKNATDELIAREIESVDKPTDIEQFKTEKRNALVGEKVLITNPRVGSAGVVGEIFTVTHANSGCVDVGEIKAVSSDWAFIPDEYEVLVEETPVIELQDSPPKTNNQQRSVLNQRAREFVEHFIEEDGDIPFNHGDKEVECTPKFIVNEKNRMVTVLLRGCNTGKLYAKGIAICAPGDVFNKWIGKAIALARALEIIVPYEFLNAVQPDEKVPGMMVYHPFHKETMRLVDSKTFNVGDDVAHYNSLYVKRTTIINDTNAIYEEVSQ